MRRWEEVELEQREPRREPALPPAWSGISNHALARVLARNPNPALERDPTMRPPKPPLQSGRQVDAIFDASPFFKDLVGAKLKKLPLAKVMHLDDEHVFEAAWIEYAMRSVNPETNRKFSREEAKAFIDAKGLRAFQDEDKGAIHVRKVRADLRTQLHEALHLFSHDRWKDRMALAYNVNEGFTQYFTRKLGERARAGGRRRLVPEAVHVGLPPRRGGRRGGRSTAAYFEGDLRGPEGGGRRAQGRHLEAVARPARRERLQGRERADALERQHGGDLEAAAGQAPGLQLAAVQVRALAHARGSRGRRRRSRRRSDTPTSRTCRQSARRSHETRTLARARRARAGGRCAAPPGRSGTPTRRAPPGAGAAGSPRRERHRHARRAGALDEPGQLGQAGLLGRGAGALELVRLARHPGALLGRGQRPSVRSRSRCELVRELAQPPRMACARAVRSARARTTTAPAMSRIMAPTLTQAAALPSLVDDDVRPRRQSHHLRGDIVFASSW